MNIVTKSRARNGQRGNVMVEMAFSIPVLLFLFLGTWSFGYAYYIYAELEAAVRTGDRYASLITYDATSTSAYQAAVQNMVVYGDPAGGTQPVTPGLQSSNVNVVVGFASNAPKTVAVSISGYKIPGMFIHQATMTNKPSLEMPFMGHYLP